MSNSKFWDVMNQNKENAKNNTPIINQNISEKSSSDKFWDVMGSSKFDNFTAEDFTTELGKIPDFIKQSASDFRNYGYSSSDDVYKGIVSGVDNYKRTIENAKKYNPQWYEKNKVNIDDTVKALDEVYNSYTNKKNMFGKYASEDEYNAAIDTAEKMSFDPSTFYTNATNKVIAAYNFQDMINKGQYDEDTFVEYLKATGKYFNLSKYKNPTEYFLAEFKKPNSVINLNAEIKNLLAQTDYKTLNDFVNAYNYARSAKDVQDNNPGFTMARNAMSDPEFEKIASSWKDSIDFQKWHNTDYLTEDEKKVVAYYLAKGNGDTHLADNYLDALGSALAYREGQEIAEKYKDSTGGAVWYDSLNSVLNSMNFVSNFSEMANGGKGEYNLNRAVGQLYVNGQWKPYYSANEVAMSINHENLPDGFWKTFDSAAVSLGQQIPSLVASTVVSFGNETVGRLVGAGITGLSAMGNTYREALIQGYNHDEATAYSVLNGSSEAVLSFLLDGVGKAGGALTKPLTNKLKGVVTKALAKVAGEHGENALLKILGSAASWGVKKLGNASSEFLEEYLQSVLDSQIRNWTLNENNEFELFDEEAFEEGLVGAFSSFLTGAAGDVVNASQKVHTYAQYASLGSNLKTRDNVQSILDYASRLDTPEIQRLVKPLTSANNISNSLLGKVYVEVQKDIRQKFEKAIGNEQVVSLFQSIAQSTDSVYIKQFALQEATLNLIRSTDADILKTVSTEGNTGPDVVGGEDDSVLPKVSAAANDAENGILKPNSGVVETESSGSVFSSSETEQNNSPKNVNSVNNTSDGGSDVEQDADVDSDKYAKDKSFWQAENKNKDAKISKTLKEKLASLFGKKTTDKPVSIGEIVKLIEKEFGVPISSGRFRHNAYGIYKNKSRAIRTKITNALPTIAHELGHHLDRIYNLHSLPSISEAMEVLKTDRPGFYSSYNPSQQPKEAVAEFLRIYLSDRALAQNKYPNFFKEFEATLNKSDLKNIQEIGDLINKYYTAAKSEAARAAVLTRTEARRIDRLGIRLSDLFERVITKLVDKAKPIKKISKIAYDRFTYALKTTVRAKNSISGYYLSGLDGKPLNLKGDEYKSITDEEGNVLAFRYLFDKLQSNEQINDFRMYLVYKHAVEWLKQDKRVFADDAINNIDFVTQQIAELEAANPIFKETAERVYLWQRVFMQEYAVKSGLVKAETLDKLNQTYPCYIPFYRHVEKGGGGAKTSVANQKSLIKRAKGSGLELYDPFENIIVMVDRWMKAADRNAVMQEIAKTADTEEGLGYLLEKVNLKQMPNSVRTKIARNSFEGAMKDYLAKQGTDAESTNNITKAILEVFDESVGESITEFKVIEFQGKSFATVMRNGKMEVYQIHDKNLLKSVMGLSEANVGNILKVLGTLTRMMKALTTGVNAIWALTSNSIRDIQSAFMYSSNNNPASFTLDYIKAVGMVLKENFTNKTTETMKLYKTAGGGFNNSLSSDLKTIRATVSDIAGKTTFIERLKKLLNILNHIENISDAIETAPRLAEFMRTYDKTKDAKKAILAAEEITVNFNRSGSFGKSVDQVIPYFNASVQGLNKLVTTLKNENGNRRAFIAKVISSAVITTLLQVAFMHIGGDDGEEEYAKLSSYKKNNFYNFYIGDGKFISISKPKELGLMASFMERTVEITTNEDADAKHEIEEYSAYAFDMLIPPLLDEAIVFGTIADIRANEDYKGTPIVSSYYESLLPEDQYNEKTSYLARILGDWFGYSPMKIDYIINSNLGVIGTLNQAFFSPEGDLTGGIKNKFYTDNAYSTDTFNKFYENAEKAAQTAASNPNDAEAIYRNKQYNSVKSVVSALNQYGKDFGLEREYKIYAQQYVADFEKNDQIDKRLVRLLNRTGDKDILYDKSFSATYSIDGVKHTIPAEQYLDYIDEYYTEIEKAYDEILRYGYSDERTVAMLKQAKSDVEKKLKKKYKTGE